MKLVVGCGYLGSRVARRWLTAGHQVAAVVQTEASAALLEAQSIRALIADVTRPETLANLPAAETLLYCVGHGAGSSASRQALYVDGLRATLDAVSPEVRRVIFISSTGVYAEQNGGWVDENSPCRPTRESSRALLAGEQVLAGHPLGRCSIVLRLAGIYGPGRLPRDVGTVPVGVPGEPATGPAGQYINLIHADDAAAAVLAAEALARPPRTYNIADGHPTRRRELAELAMQAGLAPPASGHPRPSAVATPRGGDKRVCNRRMLEELRVKLEYPTFQEGLKALAPGA